MTKQYIPQELIRKKRDGLFLSDSEIGFLVKGISDGGLTDSQLGAFAMAIFQQGMSMEERVSLTKHMMHSGEVLQWQDMKLDGPVVDKHSTGGVGDKVSLMLAPIVAACGGYVPMISGRGLGHTGGTLDKLESIPGYDGLISSKQFKQIVKDVGISIIGQTDEICPADRKIYMLRGKTDTVASFPLICGSIMGKKIAEGIEGLLLDIKTGKAAFMETKEDAVGLGEFLKKIGLQFMIKHLMPI
mgnify:CR=1 FL=1